MKQIITHKIIATSLSLTLVFAPFLSEACTAVNITAKDGSVVAGRTMEWAFDMKWQLTVNPKGTAIALTAPSSM